jgi:hypothetical protein
MTQIQLPGITQPQLTTSPIYKGSHFTWGEATNEGTRIPCQTSFGGIIIPAAQITSNIVKLAHKLDEIRELLGDKPITITSWLRPPDVNKAIGGVPNSQHLLGWAADLQVEGLDPYQVYTILKKIWAGGLGNNPVYTHVDLRQLMGWSSARWNYGNA